MMVIRASVLALEPWWQPQNRHSPQISLGFAPPSLQTKGYIVMEHMKAENNPGLWEDIKSTEEFLALAFSVIGAVKELHRHGRLLTDYGANQYMLSGDAFRLKTHDVDCLDEGRVNGE